MACFLVPAAEAVVTTVASKILEAKEKDAVAAKPQGAHLETQEKIPFSRKLKWLNAMLWGGVILLAFEHLWHGEIVPWFPFLTAASEGAEAVSEMLHEMLTVGVTMALLVTAVWGVIVAVVSAWEKRAAGQDVKAPQK
ncbi:MAG: hypothetical protein IJK64_09215 [Clostridia bacterium]|nr:hypothetical protein [Clostridia bacterium]